MARLPTLRGQVGERAGEEGTRDDKDRAWVYFWNRLWRSYRPWAGGGPFQEENFGEPARNGRGGTGRGRSRGKGGGLNKCGSICGTEHGFPNRIPNYPTALRVGRWAIPGEQKRRKQPGTAAGGRGGWGGINCGSIFEITCGCPTTRRWMEKIRETIRRGHAKYGGALVSSGCKGAATCRQRRPGLLFRQLRWLLLCPAARAGACNCRC